MDFLCLRAGSGLAGADGPDGLVGENDLSEVGCAEVEEGVLDLGLDDLVLLVGLTLLEYFADAEDYLPCV